MATLKILSDEDDFLRKVAKPVEAFDGRLHMLLDDMHETLYESNGIGLAATQVGRLMRVFIMIDFDKTDDDVDGEVLEFINPVIMGERGVKRHSEGCLSISGVQVRKKRAKEVTVRAQNRHGEYFTMDLEGILAICAQHEMDHLDGKLITDGD